MAQDNPIELKNSSEEEENLLYLSEESKLDNKEDAERDSSHSESDNEPYSAEEIASPGGSPRKVKKRAGSGPRKQDILRVKDLMKTCDSPSVQRLLADWLDEEPLCEAVQKLNSPLASFEISGASNQNSRRQQWHRISESWPV